MRIYLLSILLFINILLYGFSLVFIIKKKNNSIFSIRSPLLLLTNNLGGFLMSLTIIVYHIIDQCASLTNLKNLYINNNSNSLLDKILLNYSSNNLNYYCNYYSNYFLLFHLLFFMSFILRCDRLIKTCKIRYLNNIEDIKKFYSKKVITKYIETYYAKVLCTIIAIFLIILILTSFFYPSFKLYPYQFDKCILMNNINYLNQSLTWNIISFIEGLILITYCFLIIQNDKLTYGIRIELISFTIIWIIYPNIRRLFERDINLFNGYEKNTNMLNSTSLIISSITLFILWLCLIINAYLPWIYIIKKEKIYKINLNIQNESANTSKCNNNTSKDTSNQDSIINCTSNNQSSIFKNKLYLNNEKENFVINSIINKNEVHANKKSTFKDSKCKRINKFYFKRNTYPIMPEHLSNFYIYLSDEKCFKVFKNYLNSDSIDNQTKFINNNNSYSPNLINNSYSNSLKFKSIKSYNSEFTNKINVNNKPLLCLKLYTTLMSYRMYFTIAENYSNIYQYANGIYNKYFNSQGLMFNEIKVLINVEILDNITNKFNFIDEKDLYLEIFDEVIVFCFGYLHKHFKKFIKDSSEFHELYKEITIKTAIKDALIAVGLVHNT